MAETNEKKASKPKKTTTTSKSTASKNTAKKTTTKKTVKKKASNTSKTNKTTKKSTTTKKSSEKKVDLKEDKKVVSESPKEDIAKEKPKTEVKKKTIKNKATSPKKENPEKVENDKEVKEEIKSKEEKIDSKPKATTKPKKKIAKPKKVRPEEIKEVKPKEEIKETKDESLEKKEEKEQEKNKDIETSELKEILGTTDKPEYVQKMIRDRKKIKSIIATLIITFILLVIISTSFAIANMNNSNIINGVSVKNIKVSSLSKEDAVKQLTEATNKELTAEINLKFNSEYSVTLKPEQIEFQYQINDAVEKAFSFGRSGNILFDNYEIIFTTLFGKEVKLDYTYNGDLLNQFVEDINSKLPGLVVEPTYYIEEDKLFVNKGVDGIQVKKEDLKAQIIQAIIDRNINEIEEGYVQNLTIPTENVKAQKIDMEKIYSEIHCEPKNAYFEKDPYKIYPDVDGIDLVISANDAQNEVEKEEKEEYTFDLKITEAEITIDELGTEAFPYLISRFTTKYDASNRNRSTNLQIAAEKINGKVLMPGEEFSFNKIVGKRTVEAGYKDAAIYADGGVVDGLAGGICQISSTLYNSVLLANLQITERRNHSFTTSYSPAGKDATVVWGTTDFRFINSRSYPIKLEASVKNGIAEFKIHGMQEETEYEVRIIPVRTQSIPYKVTYQEDPTVAPGQQIIKQAGHAGCKVTTYKELRLNGEVVSKEPISNDTYQPMRTIIRVAPGNVPPQ